MAEEQDGSLRIYKVSGYYSLIRHDGSVELGEHRFNHGAVAESSEAARQRVISYIRRNIGNAEFDDDVWCEELKTGKEFPLDKRIEIITIALGSPILK